MRLAQILGFALIWVLGNVSTSSAQAPTAGIAYQIPAGFEAYPAGTLITYGGYNYVTQANGTMLLAATQNVQPVQVPQVQTYQAQSYQIPAGYSGYPVGTVINYGGANYTIQPNGMMAPYWVIQQDMNRLNADQNRLSNDYYRLGNNINNGNVGGILNDLIRIGNDQQRVDFDRYRLQQDFGGGYVPYYPY